MNDPDFQLLDRSNVEALKALGSGKPDTSRGAQMADLSRVHALALCYDAQHLFPRPGTPLRNEITYALAAGAGRHSVVTITPGVSEVFLFDLWLVGVGGQSTFLYLEPVSQTNPIEANSSVIAPLARLTVYGTPTFTVTIGDKAAGTYPNNTPGTNQQPARFTNLDLTSSAVADRYMAPGFRRIPVGYRLCAVANQANAALGVQYVACDLTPGVRAR